MFYHRKIAFLFCFHFFYFTAFSAYNTISIGDAAKKGLVKLWVKGKGGCTGDVISIKIKNLKDEVVKLTVEAGRRLDSQDSVQQDILINKAEIFTLLPKQESSFDISGMCCQAHNSSPRKEEIFSIGKMADSNLIKLACFIDRNKWWDNYVAQSAIWIISDNERMENIGGNDSVSKKLQVFVSKLTGKPIPIYKIDYETDTSVAFSGKAGKISGTFEYDIYDYGLVAFGIYDAQGHVVKMFFNGVPKNAGHHTCTYEFQTSYLPPGNYYARLRLDGQVKKEQKFTF